MTGTDGHGRARTFTGGGSVLCLLLAFGLAGARTPTLSFAAEVGLRYDNNLFEYSPHDESTFQRYLPQSDYAERFRAVRSLDDVVADVGATLNWRPSIVRRHTSIVGLTLRGRQCVSNPVKSYLSGSLRLRQYFAKGTWVEGSYLLIPQYLIRNYREPGTENWLPCTFAEHLVRIRGGAQPLKWLELALFGAHEIDVYAPGFKAYDTRAWRFGGDAEIAPGAFGRIGLNYEGKLARAQGPMPDISYNQHAAGVALRPRFGRLGLELGYDYAWRAFTATRAIDSTHAGRVDQTHGVSGGVSFQVAKNLTLALDLGQERRWSSAPFDPAVDEVKNYDRWWGGASLRIGE